MKIGRQNLGVSFMLIVVILILTGSVSAITGSIGNGKMVIGMKQGESIERYILVKNVNNVSVNIEMEPSGDLADYIKIKDNNFVLEPGEEKKAYFTLVAKIEGTTESNINVKFSPLEGKNGIGLSATIIINAEKSSFFDSIFGKNNSSEEEPENEVEDEDSGEDSPAINKKILYSSLILTAVILLVFLFLLRVYLKKRANKPKKSVGRR